MEPSEPASSSLTASMVQSAMLTESLHIEDQLNKSGRLPPGMSEIVTDDDPSSSPEPLLPDDNDDALFPQRIASQDTHVEQVKSGIEHIDNIESKVEEEKNFVVEERDLDEEKKDLDMNEKGLEVTQKNLDTEEKDVDMEEKDLVVGETNLDMEKKVADSEELLDDTIKKFQLCDMMDLEEGSAIILQGITLSGAHIYSGLSRLTPNNSIANIVQDSECVVLTENYLMTVPIRTIQVDSEGATEHSFLSNLMQTQIMSEYDLLSRSCGTPTSRLYQSVVSTANATEGSEDVNLGTDAMMSRTLREPTSDNKTEVEDMRDDVASSISGGEDMKDIDKVPVSHTEDMVDDLKEEEVVEEEVYTTSGEYEYHGPEAIDKMKGVSIGMGDVAVEVGMEDVTAEVGIEDQGLTGSTEESKPIEEEEKKGDVDRSEDLGQDAMAMTEAQLEGEQTPKEIALEKGMMIETSGADDEEKMSRDDDKKAEVDDEAQLTEVKEALAGDSTGARSMDDEEEHVEERVTSVRKTSDSHRTPQKSADAPKKRKHHKRAQEVFTSTPAPSKADASTSRPMQHKDVGQSVFESKPRTTALRVDASSRTPGQISGGQDRSVFESVAVRSQADASYNRDYRVTTSPTIVEKIAQPSTADVSSSSSPEAKARRSVFAAHVSPSTADASALSPLPSGSQRAVYASNAAPSKADVRACDPPQPGSARIYGVFESAAASSTADARALDTGLGPNTRRTLFENVPVASGAHVRAADPDIQKSGDRTVFEAGPRAKPMVSARWNDPVTVKGSQGVYESQPAVSTADAGTYKEVSDYSYDDGSGSSWDDDDSNN